MPEIRSFRGWRYNPLKIKELACVFAPPYDVISKKEQNRLYRLHRKNVIRLELGRVKKGDTPSRSCYTRAANFLKSWKSSGVLIREESPALYVHVQNYREEGIHKTRLGFFAAMKLNERQVLRHENTLSGPKKDRLRLLKKVRTNLSPIFGLFEDPGGRVQRLLKETIKNPPVIGVQLAGVCHRLYPETRAQRIRDIQAALKARPMHIADGHHRFEVACQFRNWMRTKGKKAGPWEYALTYFSDCRHNPFKIYPTHRLLHLPGKTDALAALRKKGSLKKVSGLTAILKSLSKNRAESADKKYRFGVYVKDKGFFIFTLRNDLAPSPRENPVRRLDVSVLHERLIEPCFGVVSDGKSEALDFMRDAGEAAQKVRSGNFELAFFLRPASLKEMLSVSKKGLRMPQKSTYFYPKLLTGLVFHSFDDK